MCRVFKGYNLGETYLFAGEMIVLMHDECRKVCLIIQKIALRTQKVRAFEKEE